MAVNGIKMVLVLVLVLVLADILWNGAAVQLSCIRVLMGLTPCLNFVSGNSSTPSSSCCSQLSSVVQSRPRCLCYVLNGTATSYGYNINRTQALSLPRACDVQTPPVSQCSGANGPSASAPAPTQVNSPDDSTDETPETPTTPSESDSPLSGAGSKAVPSTRTTSSAGSTARSPFHLAVFPLFIVSCVLPATRF